MYLIIILVIIICRDCRQLIANILADYLLPHRSFIQNWNMPHLKDCRRLINRMLHEEKTVVVKHEVKLIQSDQKSEMRSWFIELSTKLFLLKFFVRRNKSNRCTSLNFSNRIIYCDKLWSIYILMWRANHSSSLFGISFAN